MIYERSFRALKKSLNWPVEIFSVEAISEKNVPNQGVIKRKGGRGEGAGGLVSVFFGILALLVGGNARAIRE